MAAFLELRALALLFALGCMLTPLDARAGDRSDPASRTAIENPTAIVYVSPWCGHVYKNPPGAEPYRNVCQQAMHELEEANVPFETRDIFDDRWRGEYVEKMQSIGRRPPAVPLIDIEGVVVLGARTGLRRIASDLRKGVEPKVDEEARHTKPPSPLKPVYEAGTKWVEPPESPAVVYRGTSCPHCPATKKFLEKNKVESVEVSWETPDTWDELQAHMARFGSRGGTSPSLYIYGRFLIGFDDQAIEALVHWRRTAPKETAPSERKTPSSGTIGDARSSQHNADNTDVGPSIRASAVDSKDGRTHIITVDARDPSGIKSVELIWRGHRSRKLVCGKPNPARPFRCSRRGSRYVFRVPAREGDRTYVARYTNGDGETRHSASQRTRSR